jgi:hypothetical protein
MTHGLDELLEELRAATDTIVALPDGLLDIAMGTGPWDLPRRIDRLDMRLPALRCLVDVREIGKALSRTPASDSVGMSKVIEEAEAEPNERNLHHLVVIFNLTEQGLGDLTLTLGDTALAGAEVTVQAMDAIARAQAVYRQLQTIPGEALLASAMLPEIADHADRIGQAGRLLIEKVDEHRRTLDRAYGRG